MLARQTTIPIKGITMSNELQNDSAESEVIESAEIENQDDGAELAPASEAEHEEQPQVDEEAKKQESIQKVINEKTFKAKQAEREANELREKLEKIEAEKREQMAQQVGDIPPMPDAFDDDFDKKVKARDEALLKKAQFDSQQLLYQQQQQQLQQQKELAKQAEIQKAATSYASKATELGIKQEELQVAANTVATYGLNDDLVVHILNDPDGPLITQHLAANAQDGIDLASMNPYEVGAFLNEIKQKASALKPKTSNAPAPATKIDGKGADPELGKYKNLGGVKFE